MDIDIEKRINESIEYLKRVSPNKYGTQLGDPVAKMMLVTLLHECQKIQDYVDGLEDKIIDKYCEAFIPVEKISATPAIALVSPRFKSQKMSEVGVIGNGAVFTYKLGGRQAINYVPLFRTLAVPYQGLYVLTPQRLSCHAGSQSINMGKKNALWVGIETKAEINCMDGVSILIRGTNGIAPLRISVETDSRSLEFAGMAYMENIRMVEPFDAQQSSGKFFSMIDRWKDHLLSIDDGTLVYITDSISDRDIFKPRIYPRVFQHWLESETLDCFKNESIWLQVEFPDGYVVPDDCSVVLNVFPVVNVDENSLTLTPSAPIAKLQKQDNSYFLQIIETSSNSLKQGFESLSEDIVVRDFDASCYNNGDLYRDVRNLYNHFIDDYYAFIEYNGIKDGEVVKLLREAINKVGKSVGLQNAKFNFDSGTYVMKNMNQNSSTLSTKVSFLTTLGKIGNTPRVGEMMENKKLPLFEKDVAVVVSAVGGTDKASADSRYELLRYYTLTNDRLYTRKDIEAFIRKEIILEFGKEEFKRIFYRIAVEGAAGEKHLQRGLYIDITFKDKKNLDHALAIAFDKQLHQKIENLSCISMPIIVALNGME